MDSHPPRCPRAICGSMKGTVFDGHHSKASSLHPMHHVNAFKIIRAMLSLLEWSFGLRGVAIGLLKNQSSKPRFTTHLGGAPAAFLGCGSGRRYLASTDACDTPLSVVVGSRGPSCQPTTQVRATLDSLSRSWGYCRYRHRHRHQLTHTQPI